MKHIKKIFVALFTLLFFISSVPTNVFATTESTTISLEGLNEDFQSYNNTSLSKQIKDVLNNTSINVMKRRSMFAIRDDVFVGNGTLIDGSDMDIYQINTPSTSRLGFLKLNSTNSNLIAGIFKVVDGNATLTNLFTTANSGISLGELAPIGTTDTGSNPYYVIIILSSNPTEGGGDYDLMWNCSNSFGAKQLISYTNDLSTIALYYDRAKLLINGKNILPGLKWEYSKTWYQTYGHISRSMSIELPNEKTLYDNSSLNPIRGILTGSISSDIGYSIPNALFLDVNYGNWTYTQTAYQNIHGLVDHLISWEDPSQQLTPRTFGNDTDFYYGHHYIVIDLDTSTVRDFISSYNYNYTERGGYTYTVSNITTIQ